MLMPVCEVRLTVNLFGLVKGVSPSWLGLNGIGLLSLVSALLHGIGVYCLLALYP